MTSTLTNCAPNSTTSPQPEKKGGRSPREERIIAGFEEIQRFVEQHGRAPQHGEDRDIFERLYAVRLDRLRALEECRALLAPLDHQGLLAGAETVAAAPAETMDDDELAGRTGGRGGRGRHHRLRHVRTSAEKRAAEEIANREQCEDFEQLQAAVRAGARRNSTPACAQTRPFRDARPRSGRASSSSSAVRSPMSPKWARRSRTQHGSTDARLRVIYRQRHGEQSAACARFSARFTRTRPAGASPTRSPGRCSPTRIEDGDLASGTIYVLRSKSDHPVVAANRDVLHKIGVTGGDVARRIANAKLDPTFLMADVEIVATYELYNINRTKLENLIHRIFDPARLDIEIKDRFGHPVIPREWFLVPLFVIDEAVERIKDGTISVLYTTRIGRFG